MDHLTNMKTRLIKRGVRTVRHSRAITFHLFEVAINGGLSRAWPVHQCERCKVMASPISQR